MYKELATIIRHPKGWYLSRSLLLGGIPMAVTLREVLDEELNI